MNARLRTKLLRQEHGYTLMELLVSMVIGVVVTGAAFAMLQFTSQDVTLTAERARLDQSGRVALENVMLQLHSACVALNVHPVEAGSNENELKFVSERSPLNEAYKEPTASFTKVRVHKLIFTEAQGTLVEKSWTVTPPNYKPNESETPTTRLLLRGVSRTIQGGVKTPIFQYYRYYRTGDTIPSGEASLPYGELNPEAIPASKLASEVEAERVAKVAVSFTLAPEGKEAAFAKGARAVAFEDSAILRLAPSSEASSNTNLPCTQQT